MAADSKNGKPHGIPGYHLLKWMLRILAVAIATVLSIPVVIVFGLWLYTYLPWAAESVAIDRVVASTSIVIKRKPLHPFLAEFSRELILIRGNSVIGRTALFEDTGGTVRINIYQTAPNTLVLVDRFDIYTADLGSGVVVRSSRHGEISDSVPEDGYIGAFDNIRQNNGWFFRFIPAKEVAEVPIAKAAGG
ncbi:hypothetical protein [Roseomonas gilardii]|uniref:hypothetical protein n=1 Tax=Roseomonas gilardii TaxID=257708 RepID=UPI0012EC50A4|nr:hypothetical protein [Roseomonas gilardii]